MALTNFIPELWSETLWKELEPQYIAVKNCNRDYEGDIKNKGDQVHIPGIGPVTLLTYTRNTDLTAPEVLTDTTRTLEITQADAYNFQIDDVDKAQTNVKLMKAAMKEAASTLANAADVFVYKLYSDSAVTAANTLTAENVTSADVVNLLVEARQKLQENNVPNNTEVFLEISPAFAAKITLANILKSTDNTGTLDKGYLGSFMGFKIFVSNNIQKVTTGEDDAAVTHHKCFIRTKRAISFAEQLNSVEAYRMEKRFSDAVKGLHLYGAKLIYPKEFLLLNVSIGAES